MRFSFKISNEANISKIKELEQLLASKRAEVEQLQEESIRVFEAEETIAKLQEENEVLKYEIEVAASKISSVDEDHSKSKGEGEGRGLLFVYNFVVLTDLLVPVSVQMTASV